MAVHQVFVNEEYCKGADDCGICLWVCPRNVFAPSDRLTAAGVRPPKMARIEDCSGCENCMLYCPDFAIVVVKGFSRRSLGTQTPETTGP